MHLLGDAPHILRSTLNCPQEMYETYIKWLMNPFYDLNAPIKSQAFERKAQLYGRKYLTG